VTLAKSNVVLPIFKRQFCLAAGNEEFFAEIEKQTWPILFLLELDNRKISLREICEQGQFTGSANLDSAARLSAA
jgi:hypothetical protein